MCVQDVRSESGMWCSTRGSMVLAVSWTPPFLVTMTPPSIGFVQYICSRVQQQL
jgi:hypothetical protein